MKDLLEALAKNGDAIKTAWIPIVLLVSAVGAAMYLAARWRYQGMLDGLKATNETQGERLKHRDEQVDELKAKVGTDVPSEIKARLDGLESQIEKLKPWRLGEEVVKKISNSLRKLPGHVRIDYEGSAPGAKIFSRELIRSFEQAGWSVDGGLGLGTTHCPPSGICVRVPHSSSLTPKQALIVDSLNEAGFDFELLGVVLPGQYLDKPAGTNGIPDAGITITERYS